jgi:hypothetical protein
MFHDRTIERMVETVRPDASALQRWRARSTRSRSARRGSAGGETRGAPARGRVRGGGDVSSTGGAFDDVFGDSSEIKFSAATKRARVPPRTFFVARAYTSRRRRAKGEGAAFRIYS